MHLIRQRVRMRAIKRSIYKLFITDYYQPAIIIIIINHSLIIIIIVIADVVHQCMQIFN
jgi:hypothetical protein